MNPSDVLGLKINNSGFCPMSEKKTISRATGVLGGATLLSRITGLMRDMVVGRIFGAGFATDAFFMAFRERRKPGASHASASRRWGRFCCW
jgi:hypothetical protein